MLQVISALSMNAAFARLFVQVSETELEGSCKTRSLSISSQPTVRRLA
jgi:hypothetical protein